MSDYIEHDRGGPDVREPSASGWSSEAEPATIAPKGKHLATIAVAALAPTLIKSAFKFVTRHPLLTVAGLAGYSVAMLQSQHRTHDLAA